MPPFSMWWQDAWRQIIMTIIFHHPLMLSLYFPDSTQYSDA